MHELTICFGKEQRYGNQQGACEDDQEPEDPVRKSVRACVIIVADGQWRLPMPSSILTEHTTEEWA